MDYEILSLYIDEYQKRFHEISNHELYKWRAVKNFQDNWDENARDFGEMLSRSLAKTKNLLDSGNYYPRRMIIENADKNPEMVRSLFIKLFNEDVDLIERIETFSDGISQLNAQEFPGKKDYQDHRAIIVYLALRYPETYYLYKYNLLKSFVQKIKHEYKPVIGAISNIHQFFYIANNVKEKIVQRNALIKLHKDRLGVDDYFDTSYNILTQDFIYAVDFYLSVEEKAAVKSELSLTFHNLEAKPIPRTPSQFTGHFTNRVSREKRNQQIGDIGEELVFDHERSHCSPKYSSKVIHAAKTEGDGLGYDILSYQKDGAPKYIEVKTTTGPVNTPFYVSAVELERSKKEGQSYYLYRLYNLDEESLTADYIILRGDLSAYCINPIEFQVKLSIATGSKGDRF